MTEKRTITEEGLTVYFNKPITSDERDLIQFMIFVTLGKNTDCRIADVEEVDGKSIVLIVSRDPLDLIAVGNALWGESSNEVT